MTQSNNCKISDIPGTLPSWKAVSRLNSATKNATYLRHSKWLINQNRYNAL